MFLVRSFFSMLKLFGGSFFRARTLKMSLVTFAAERTMVFGLVAEV